MRMTNQYRFAGQSFTSVTENGVPTWRLNMEPRQKYHVHQDQVHERRVVHTMHMGDVEDPDLYVAQPIFEWQQTEKGKWVMDHTLEPTYHIMADPLSYGYRISITAHITPKRWTEFCLRFS